MTAPLPSPRLSPMAGLFNGAVRLLNRRLRTRIGELNTQLADAINVNHELRDAASFTDSRRSGYVDRTGLEA
ncbi:hypothetical protein ACFYVK_35030 [Streptomyces chartreusis]|uniref:hypothetical protein n=1 Tax=Streptomyces chartreusis TaxID=1969 RepID=UPI0036A60983